MTPKTAYRLFKTACGDSAAKVEIWDQVVTEGAELGLPMNKKGIRDEIAQGFLDGSNFRPGSAKPFRKHKGAPPAPTVRTYDFETPERGYFQIMLRENDTESIWVLKTLRKSERQSKATFGSSSALAAQFKALKQKMENQS